MTDTAATTLSNTQDGAQAPSFPVDAITLPIVISEWQKNSREILRVRLDEYKGQTVIDCRAWYGEPDNLKAGRGGLTLSVKQLPALAAGLVEALDLARRHVLLERLNE